MCDLKARSTDAHDTQKEALKLYLENPELNPKLSFDFNRVQNVRIVQFSSGFFSLPYWASCRDIMKEKYGLHMTSVHCAFTQVLENYSVL